MANSRSGQKFLAALGATAERLGNKAAVGLENKAMGKMNSISNAIEGHLDRYLG